MNRTENTFDFIEALRTAKQDFTLEYNGAGVTINHGNREYKFTGKYISKKVFIAKALILKDALCSDVFGMVLKHDTDLNKYFGNAPVVNTGHYKKLILIDINSAYLSALKLNGVIKEKAFEFTNNLPKHSRLITLGMFAKRQEIYEYKRGEIFDTYEVKSPYSNLFFLPAYIIDKLMETIGEAIQHCYVFYWFDGIYIIPQPHALKQVEDILKQSGYKHKVEPLQDVYIYNNFPKNIFCFKKMTHGILKEFVFQFDDVNMKRLLEIRHQKIMSAPLEKLIINKELKINENEYIENIIKSDYTESHVKNV